MATAAGAFLAAVALAAVDAGAGALDHRITPFEVRGLPILIVSGIAAVPCSVAPSSWEVTSIISMTTTRAILKMGAVPLDTAADAAAAAGVAISGAVILLTGGVYWLDPAVALVVASVVACSQPRSRSLRSETQTGAVEMAGEVVASRAMG